MTEWSRSSVERPRDVYGVLVWVAGCLRPLADAAVFATWLAMATFNIRGTAEERNAAHALMFMAVMATVGCVIATLLPTVSRHYLFDETQFVITLLSSPVGMFGFNLVHQIADPVLWVGLICGYTIRNIMNTPGGVADCFFAERVSSARWAVHFLGFLLFATVLCHCAIFLVGSASMSILNSVQYGVEDPISALMDFLLIRSGVGPIAWNPITFPATHWIVVHAITWHVANVFHLWALCSVVAYLCVRLPSFAVAALAAFILLTVLNCYVSLLSIGRLHLPIPLSIREGLGAFFEGAYGIPTAHANRLIPRAEALAIGSTILAVLAWQLRRFFERLE